MHLGVILMGMYPHVCTAWIRSTEGRQAVWEKKIINPCRFEEVAGAAASVSGDASARSAQMLIPGNAEGLKRDDKVMLGTIASNEPPADAYVVETCAPVGSMESSRHWEVYLT